MFRYLLKIASLDENLIVKQKARFFNHILEYQEAFDISKFTQPEHTSAKDENDGLIGEEFDTAAIMTVGSGVRVQKATSDEIQEAEQARKLGYQEYESEMFSSLGDGGSGSQIEVGILGSSRATSH